MPTDELNTFKKGYEAAIERGDVLWREALTEEGFEEKVCVYPKNGAEIWCAFQNGKVLKGFFRLEEKIVVTDCGMETPFLSEREPFHLSDFAIKYWAEIAAPPHPDHF
jgi:hypothetical protein